MMFPHLAPAHVGRMEKTPKNTKKNKKIATSSVLGKVPFHKKSNLLQNVLKLLLY